MDKYFLMGLDSVRAFEEFGVPGLLDEKGQDGFTIIKYNERTSLLKDLMDAVLGWDCYVEIFYEDVKQVAIEKNHREWRDFFCRIDPEAKMTDGETIDHMMQYYKAPELIHLDQL